MHYAEKLRKEFGEDSPLAALVEAGPDQMERFADALTKKIPVSIETIDKRVVEEFSRLIKEIAEEKGHDLNMVQPFIYDALYPEVMEEVKKGSSLGLQYYEAMVKQMPHRFYFE